MKKSIYLILFAIVVSITGEINAQTTMFGVTPNHTGVYNYDFPSSPDLIKKWSVKTQGKIFSSAVVQNGVVYFGSDDSCLYAIDTSGVEKWKYKSNGKIRSAPVLNDSTISFNNYSGTFYTLDIQNGDSLWSYNIAVDATFDEWDFYQSSPVFLDTVVYFGSGNYMYALNLNSRDTLWSFYTSGIIHSSPALDNGKIFFGSWNRKLYALDAYTGTKIWEYATADGIPSSPTVVDSFVFIGSRDANVYAINVNTGLKIWSTSFNGSWMPSSFAIKGDTVYTGSSDAKRFYALNKGTGAILYSVSLPYFAFSTPAFSNGTAFIGCMNGSLYCIDTKIKIIGTTFNTEGHINDYYNALNDNGTINTAVVKDPQYVQMMLTTGTIASTPVIDNSIVYFGSSDSSFYAVYVEEYISGISDIAGNQFANIYPNPSNKFITIESTKMVRDIRIYDIRGAVCKNINIPASGNRIDISSLSEGVYFIVYTIDGKQGSQKFIKH